MYQASDRNTPCCRRRVSLVAFSPRAAASESGVTLTFQEPYSVGFFRASAGVATNAKTTSTTATGTAHLAIGCVLPHEVRFDPVVQLKFPATESQSRAASHPCRRLRHGIDSQFRPVTA